MLSASISRPVAPVVVTAPLRSRSREMVCFETGAAGAAGGDSTLLSDHIRGVVHSIERSERIRRFYTRRARFNGEDRPIALYDTLCTLKQVHFTTFQIEMAKGKALTSPLQTTFRDVWRRTFTAESKEVVKPVNRKGALALIDCARSFVHIYEHGAGLRVL